MNNDLKYMRIAFKEAKKAYDLNEIPVGCVIVCDDKIVAKAYNLRNTKRNAIYHAEVLAINKACKKLDRWILDDCTMYVTMEPCIMCAGTILQARIGRVVYGAKQDRYGVVDTMMHLFTDYKFNNCPEVTSGIMEEENKELIQDFFKKLRDEKKRGK